MSDIYTSADFESALRAMETLDGCGLPFSVYEASRAALRIAANVMRPKAIEAVVAGYEGVEVRFAGSLPAVIRAALTAS